MVTISRSAGGEEDNMCFLTIMKTEIFHAGEWSCHLHGDCQEMEGKTGYDLSEKLVEKRENLCQCDEQDTAENDLCKNYATQMVKLEIVEADTIAVLVGQDLYLEDIESESNDLEIAGDDEQEECIYI